MRRAVVSGERMNGYETMSIRGMVEKDVAVVREASGGFGLQVEGELVYFSRVEANLLLTWMLEKTEVGKEFMQLVKDQKKERRGKNE